MPYPMRLVHLHEMPKTQLMYNESLFGTKYITNYAQSVVIAQQDRDEISIMNKYKLVS